jgi:WD40-like Beta Propeller Repeat
VTASRPSAELRALGEHGTALKLEPLSEAQTAALIGSLGELPATVWGHALSHWIASSTYGSPLLILESLQLALERGSLLLEDHVWGCPNPRALATELAAGGALRHRIEELDRTSQWILLTMAVAGTPLSVSVLARLAARAEPAIALAIAALEERGLLVRAGDEWEPAHDEIAALALETATPDALRAAHAGLGKSLMDAAELTPTLFPHAACHLAASGETGLLVVLWRRWLKDRRRSGDRRRPVLLATELLGEAASAAVIRQLTSHVPLPVRLGVDTPRRVAAVLLVTAGAAAGVAAMARSAPPVEEELLAVQPLARDSTSIYRFVLHPGDWQDLHEIEFAPHPIRNGLRAADLTYEARPRADGHAWVTARVFPDTGEQDVVLVEPDGSRQRLTFTQGDDNGPSLSPDGSLVVFSTARWNRLSHYDLAITASSGDHPLPLTRSDAFDARPAWSPDGERIAYPRRFFDGQKSLVCWITVDGRHGHCFSPPGLDPGYEVVGWVGSNRLIVSGLQGRSHVIALTDIAGKSLQILDTAARGVASPDGHWVACLVAGSDGTGTTWMVHPVDRPTDRRELRFPTGAPDDWMLAWGSTRRALHYLTRVSIESPRDVPLSVGTRLQAKGFDPQGEDVPVPLADWWTSDSTVAVIDSNGLLMPRRPGRLVVRVSAGGWREDSTVITVRPAASTTTLTEDWRGPLDRSFIPYGHPKPVLSTGPGATPAFLNNGDDNWESGAFTKRALDPATGLGFETTISTPITSTQWQVITLSILRITDGALAGWDRTTGALPVDLGIDRGCSFQYPNGEGAGSSDHWSLAAADASSLGTPPPGAISGRWLRVRVQLLPDGRCAVAIDGRPRAIIASHLPLDRPYRIDLKGKSVGTKILVGPLEVWQGVKPGVDWLALDRRRPPSP